MKVRSILALISFCFLVFVIGLGISRVLFFPNAPQQTRVQSHLPITIRSSLSQLDFDPQSVNPAIFNLLFERSSPGEIKLFYVNGRSEPVSPSQIAIEFFSTKQELPSTPIFEALDKQGKPLFLADTAYDEQSQTFFVKIWYESTMLDELSAQNRALKASRDALKVLLFSLSFEDAEKIDEKVKIFQDMAAGQQIPFAIFQLKNVQSYLRLLNPVQPAYAICTGGYECGHKSYTCTCSDTSSVCSAQGELCGNGGVCSCGYSPCEAIDNGSKSCTTLPESICSPNLGAGQCAGVNGANCILSASCNWVAPSGTPRPSASPTPPGGGNTCTDQCYPAAADCGSYGKDQGNGSCSGGQLCCKDRPQNTGTHMGAFAYCQDEGGPIYPMPGLPIKYESALAPPELSWGPPVQPSTHTTDAGGFAPVVSKQVYPPIERRVLRLENYLNTSARPLSNYPNLTLSTGQKYSDLARGPNNITLTNGANIFGSWEGKNNTVPPVNGKTYMCGPWYNGNPTVASEYIFNVPQYYIDQGRLEYNAVWRFTNCQRCVPNCSLRCGQDDGCGGTCSSVDDTTPGAPTGLLPANGATITPNASNQVTISWNPTPNASYYEVQVYPTGTQAGQECTAADSHCSANTATTSYTFTIGGVTSNYTWRVRAINARCSIKVGPWSFAQSFSLSGNISGQVFLDTGEASRINPVTGLCELAGSPATQDPGPGSSITARWGSPQVTTNGTFAGAAFAINNVSYYPNTIVTLTPDTTQFSCVCPIGCSYSGLSSPKSNVNFYVTTSKPPWWQTINGLLYAGNPSGQAVKSAIPTTCTLPTCLPALSLNDRFAVITSHGYVISGGGSIDTTADPVTSLTNLSEGGSTAHIKESKIGGPREDYTYFSQLYSMVGTQQIDFSGAQPTGAPTNGRAYYADSDVTISAPWQVGAGQSYVVFVNGNLTVNAQITVAPGGFVAFIVKKNITFDSQLGWSDTRNTQAIVAGVYIAEQQIIVAGKGGGNDLKFVGEGTFVGWGGVQLARRFTPPQANNTYPTELFRYRPDFMDVVPERMTRPIYLWQETN